MKLLTVNYKVLPPDTEATDKMFDTVSFWLNVLYEQTKALFMFAETPVHVGLVELIMS